MINFKIQVEILSDSFPFNGGLAECVKAVVCKTTISGFDSRNRLKKSIKIERKSIMNTFIKELERLDNMTNTTNGDTAFKSTLNANLDFFGLSGSIQEQEKIKELFMKAYYENPLLAIKNLFYLRGIQYGYGRRQSFRTLMKLLSEKQRDIAIKLIPYIPSLGRWDDLVILVDSKVKNEVLSIISEQIKSDLKSENCSLLGKWLPTENSPNHETKKLAVILANKLFNGDRKAYRKTCSTLRSKINILETYLVNKDYSFDYSKIPGKAMLKYTKAFTRNDYERYNNYLNELSKNFEMLSKKASKMYPYEIVMKVQGTSEDVKLGNALWKSLPKDKESKILVVRDGSGSMTWSPKNSVLPIDIADSITLYASERLTGEFKNTFITFSSKPKFVKIPENLSTLKEKFEYLSQFNDMSNTNIEKTYDLILEAFKKSPKESHPEAIVIISDMQFDGATTDFKNYSNTFDIIKNKFEEAEIELPKFVFWNVSTSGNYTFTTDDKFNALFISGFSKNIFDELLEGSILTAEDLLNKVLSRYDYLDEILK